MTVKLTGAVEYYERVPLGIYSLDRALAGGPRGQLIPGFPLRTITQFYGWKMAGKSTLANWIAGRIAGKGKIGVAALEEYDPQFIQAIMEESGYNGEVVFVTGEKDEDYVDNIDKCMAEEGFSVGIFDSLGAMLAISESEGAAGEANMGRRALLVSKLMRRARNRIRSRQTPFTLLCTNHQHPNIGSMGNSLSGGKTQEYMCSNLIEVSVYHDAEHWFEDGSHIICGKAKKVKFGPSDGKFQIFNLSGYGPHIGMSAVVDCLVEGHATKERTIKLGNKSFGYMKDLIRSAKEGDKEIFIPFLEALGAPVEKKKGKKK